MTARTREQPLSITLVEEFRESLYLGEEAQRTELATRWLDIEQRLMSEIEALSQAAYGEFGNGAQLKDWQIYELQRYQSLLAQVRTEINLFIGDAVIMINDNATDLVSRGVVDAQNLIQAVGRDAGEASVPMTFMRLNTSAVEQITALARAGQPLDELMHKAHGDAATGMVTQLIQGIALGEGPRDTARRMSDGLSKGLSHVELVARDMYNRTYRTASHEQYKQSGVVEGYRRIAAKQDNTCLACLALDGNAYETNDLMELHPQDRCAMVPNVTGLPAVQFQTADRWFATLSESEQRKIMGPTRFDAWQQGQFTWSQMASRRDNDIWGPSAIVTPVNKLLAGQGGVQRTA